MLLRTRLLAFVSILCLSAAPSAVCTEDEPPMEQAAASAEATVVIKPDAKAIEEAIAGLSHPVPDDQIAALLDAISQLPDAEEQARLHQALNDRGHQLNQEAAASSGQPAINSDSSDQEFDARIGALNLGADATAADLRARDEVVSAIIGVTDPTKREQLLEQLEERERQAETLVEPSAPR